MISDYFIRNVLILYLGTFIRYIIKRYIRRDKNVKFKELLHGDKLKKKSDEINADTVMNEFTNRLYAFALITMLLPFLKIKRLLVAIMFLVTICFCSCSKDKLAGREFDGYYHACEWISLNFEADSNVVATISSTDFVGHFSDHVYGRYEYNHPNIIITWTGVDPDNDAYKDVMSNPDRVLINESLDTLWLYEKNSKIVLPKYHLYHVDKDAPLLEQISEYGVQTELLIIIFIVNHFFSLVVAIIIFVLFMKWWKKRKNKRFTM